MVYKYQNVDSIDDLKKIIYYSKYPPDGNRGFSPFTRAGQYSIDNAKKLTSEANLNTLIAINVEGEEGVNNIDEFLRIDQLDIIFVGSFDLSKALGIPGEVDNPRVLSLLEDVTKKITEAGKYPGTIATSKEKLSTFLDFGLKYLVYLVDCEMIRSKYREVVDQFKEITSNWWQRFSSPITLVILTLRKMY